MIPLTAGSALSSLDRARSPRSSLTSRRRAARRTTADADLLALALLGADVDRARRVSPISTVASPGGRPCARRERGDAPRPTPRAAPRATALPSMTARSTRAAHRRSIGARRAACAPSRRARSARRRCRRARCPVTTPSPNAAWSDILADPVAAAPAQRRARPPAAAAAQLPPPTARAARAATRRPTRREPSEVRRRRRSSSTGISSRKRLRSP